MRDRYADLVDRVRDSVLAGSGTTTATLREAVRTRAASRHPREEASEDVPAELRGLVDTISQRAYDVTDQDVESLRRRGHTEDAIFEVTVSAALGAGLARLRSGLDALREADDAS